MQYTVDYYSMDLFIKIRLELFCIFSHSLNAYEDIPLNPQVVAVVEGDDVGERIVRQILQIEGLQILIGAKNEVDSGYVVFLRLGCIKNPLGGLAWMGKFETSFLLKKLDNGHSGIHVKTKLDNPAIFFEVDLV